MSAADDPVPLTLVEARALFAPFAKEKSVVVAVSGGPDSTALLWLAARWRASRKTGPLIVAVTIDHGLRAESAREAKAVKRFAHELGVIHRTLRWNGAKPKTGLQEAARGARYALLAQAAIKAGARIVLTAHTLDDQAETVLLRLLRGSGLSGLQAMQAMSPYPEQPGLVLARPLLAIPKARLIATLAKAGIPFADDPSNRDPRYTRVRLRALMPALLEEGLTARRMAVLAARLQRAEAALRSAVAEASARVLLTPKNGMGEEGGRIVFDRDRFRRLPAEIGLRLLGQAIAEVGDEGPVELGKLETLFEALRPEGESLRRTLAGAVITLKPAEIVVERAPPRRRPPGGGGSQTLTTGKT
ncbi:tRNA(Ile)-lysidine synthase [Pseudorhodoplanes sinuspersici]|uniref:tRNA lysidine(34) synthetase TilS n=1 Tax=Pseudorhodoplanes sinuspersici TaxID=1235591 RepID=UPI000E719188|nr:tRNA lysidine(34) synthetase TilS [Pseudorhodoplanes sinuspersici]RKE65994.1 tRNA(Ile)-lysidine synthase [Pseudorhodoplanes sinuspersici]